VGISEIVRGGEQVCDCFVKGARSAQCCEGAHVWCMWDA